MKTEYYILIILGWRLWVGVSILLKPKSVSNMVETKSQFQLIMMVLRQQIAGGLSTPSLPATASIFWITERSGAQNE